jgi:hypothetical protein
MHCIYLSVSLLPTVIDLVEQEREEPPELTPVEATNPEQDQGKPGASNHIPWALLIFVFSLLFLIVHLVDRSWIDT